MLLCRRSQPSVLHGNASHITMGLWSPRENVAPTKQDAKKNLAAPGHPYEVGVSTMP